jgi:ribosomal protein L28
LGFTRKCEICGKEIVGTNPMSAAKNYTHHKNLKLGRKAKGKEDKNIKKRGQ